MTCAGQQLAVFVLAHFFPAFLDDATQSITPFPTEVSAKRAHTIQP
jgi:hypothetical protein